MLDVMEMPGVNPVGVPGCVCIECSDSLGDEKHKSILRVEDFGSLDMDLFVGL